MAHNNYHLAVSANVRMLNIADSFSTEARYILNSLGANEQRPELSEYILEEKGVKLTNYADPNTYQLIEYVNRLATILNRQHICIDADGTIKGLLNLNEIKGKWDVLKRELMQINPIAAFEIVKQKDRELANPVELIDNMANAHFMFLFSYGYEIARGKEQTVVKETVQRDRMGIGFNVPVLKTFHSTNFGGGKMVNVTSVINDKKKIDKALLVQVTGHETFDLKHDSRAEFNYNVDDVLLAAKMHIFEQLNEEYSIDLYLELTCNDSEKVTMAY